MFSKVVALLLFATCAIAGLIPEGIYQIINLASQSPAYVDYAGGAIHVSGLTTPGQYSLWNLTNAQDNGYTIDNVGLNIIMMLDTFAAVLDPKVGEPVVTNRTATVFDIAPAGNNTFVIKIQNDDLLWDVEPLVKSQGNVTLQNANGTDTQQWLFTPSQPAVQPVQPVQN